MTKHINRRTFVKVAMAGIGSSGLNSFRGATAAVVNKPTYATEAIIDTHTHFYDPARPQGVPWPSKNDKVLYRTVLPKDYRALPKPQSVTGTVVVEASSWVEDNQWILDLAASDPFIVGFVGNLPVGTDEFRGHLKRFTANPLFRGLRIGGARLREGLEQDRFVSDLRLVAASDLAVDLLGGPEILQDVTRLAKAVPELRLIIDHVANVKIDGKQPNAAWREGMQTAGQNKNVFCKVSGLVEGTGRSDGTAPRDAEFYQPILDVVWAAFGGERLVYGSNWPVSERFASCATVQAIVSEYFSSKSKAAAEKYFWQNARVVYKWIKRDASPK